MRIVVVGASSLIDNKIMTALHDAGHQAVAASPAFGFDAFTGEGLDEAMCGADIVVDASNAPAWGDAKVLKFFTNVTHHALKASLRAGARHHVVLSALACDRLPTSGYMRARVAQEHLVRAARVPFTIVRSTPLMESLGHLATMATEPGIVRVPDAMVQPIAARDAAELVAALATKPPVNETVEIAGPEALRFDDAIGRVLASAGDQRRVVADRRALYLGARIRDDVLLPGPQARLGNVPLTAQDAEPHPLTGARS